MSLFYVYLLIRYWVEEVLLLPLEPVSPLLTGRWRQFCSNRPCKCIARIPLAVCDTVASRCYFFVSRNQKVFPQATRACTGSRPHRHKVHAVVEKNNNIISKLKEWRKEAFVRRQRSNGIKREERLWKIRMQLLDQLSQRKSSLLQRALHKLTFHCGEVAFPALTWAILTVRSCWGSRYSSTVIQNLFFIATPSKASFYITLSIS